MATFPTEPALHAHHGARSWISYWRDDAGKMHGKRFGKETICKRDALARWRQWLDLEWKTFDSIRNPLGSAAKYTCTALAAEYLRHAGRVFRKNGERTSHVTGVRYAMRALRDFRGTELAETTESPHLAALRDAMIRAGDKTRSITTVNGRLLIIKEAFAWAREKGRVPRAVVLDLLTVKPLQAGRSDAKDAKEIKPIALAVVEATLPACSSVVAAMVKVNLYTGARPGEVCIMRPCDLEMVTKDCWVYRPESHKTQHKGKTRLIAIGPKAIEAIRPFLERQTDLRGYLFSPRMARSELFERRAKEYREARKRDGRGMSDSLVDRLMKARTKPPLRPAGDHYSEGSYRKAIHHACRKAGIEPWSPNQLRHTHGTEVRRIFGMEALQDAGLKAARDTLGHSDERMSEIYAQASLQRAMEIARKVG